VGINNPVPRLQLARKLSVAAWIVSAIVLATVAMMRRVKLDVDVDFSMLPQVNAILNTGAAIALMLAYYFIRRKQIAKHRAMIFVAMGLSFVFLVCYVLYHFTTPETLFCREGWIRTVYFVLLISHIVLAAVIFPFVLFTFIRGFTGQYGRHRKMARWVFPIWLYVAISGPVVYLLLAPCY
jgi:putative membrane protein